MAVQFSLREQFAAPKERVYDALTNFDNAAKWMKGFVRFEKLKGDVFEPGAVWRETRKMFGKEATEEFEVIAAIPGREIQLRVDGTKGSSRKGEYLFRYRLEEKDGNTLLTLNAELRGLRGIAAFFARLFKGIFKKALLRDLRSMKTWVESNQTA